MIIVEKLRYKNMSKQKNYFKLPVNIEEKYLAFNKR
jgi:hypothetical protein